HEPFTEEELTPILDDFYKNGATIIRNVLLREECQKICKRVDQIFDEPYFAEMRNVKVSQPRNDHDKAPIVVHRLFECDRMFRDLLVREPIISIAEAVLGPQCHCMAQGCILNRNDFGINRFHIDDSLEFPITDDGIKYHDRRLRMPVFRMSFQIALTDQDEDQYGPSQFVPSSHYAGRQPNDPEKPSFDGQGPKSLSMKAGDLYLLSSQTWHRGAPNTSDRVRYLFHQVYGQRFVAQRFWPYLNYHMPDYVLEGADERLLRVLGKHPEMAYG
nr:phytanoyl-CoA dioxygenase family protein [Candidatus Poribacteria bacterium]